MNSNFYDALYYKSIALMDSGLTTDAIQSLNLLLTKNQNYNKIAFVLLSIAYRRS